MRPKVHKLTEEQREHVRSAEWSNVAQAVEMAAQGQEQGQEVSEAAFMAFEQGVMQQIAASKGITLEALLAQTP